MRWALLLALLATSALASRADRISVSPRLDALENGVTLTAPETVFFALTDPGNECSGAPIPGLQLSRASTQPCALASMTSSMVSPGQPAVEPDGLAWSALTSVRQYATLDSPLSNGMARVYGATITPWGSASNVGTYALFHHGNGAYDSSDSVTVYVTAQGILGIQERSPAGVAQSWRTAVGAFTQGPHNIRLVVPVPSGPPQLYVDGASVPMTLTAGTPGNREANVQGPVVVGGVPAGNQFPFRGRIRDLCLSRSAAGCPVVMVPERGGARVIALGDSITSGAYTWTASAIDYPRYLRYLLGYGLNFDANAGSSGFEASQILGRWTSDGLGKGFTHVAVLGGINDIQRDLSADAAWAALKQIVDEADFEGATVIMSTVFPYSSLTPEQNGELAYLNSLISGYAISEGHVFVDGHAIMGDPLNPDALNPAYNSGDNLHINEAGYVAFAQAVYDALNPPAPLADAGGGETLGWLGALAALGAAGAGVYAARRRSA